MLRLILIALVGIALVGTFVAVGTGATPSQPQGEQAISEDADDRGDRDEPADRGSFEPGDDDPEERSGDEAEPEDDARDDADERGGDVYEPGDDDPGER